MTKVALVTGASSGVGAAIAVWLASQGIKTYGATRHTE
jgi:NADP-dependent 3-hydroxy acid dehydrogenase YdfG